MGIPLFFKYLKKNHKDIVSKVISFIDINCTELYFDFNCVIHKCAQDVVFSKCRNIEDEVITRTCDYVNEVIRLVNPRNLVYIAVDGIPPVSKMKQQRNRRFMSQWGKNVESPYSFEQWDSNSVTPGTPFMEKLNREIRNKLKANTKIEVSDSNERGEGEQKIFKKVRSKSCETSRPFIYGLDADLIVLSLLCFSYSITILRPEYFEGGYYLIDVDKLRHEVCNTIKISDLSLEEVNTDYACLCSLMGNDFVPGLSCFPVNENSLNILITCYKTSVIEQGKPLVNNGIINMDVLKSIFRKLCDHEDICMINVDTEYYKRPNKQITFPNCIQPSKTGWRERYYTYLFNSEVNKHDVCKNYLEGLQWSLEYHLTDRVNENWYYKYTYAPTVMDISMFNTTDIHSFQQDEEVPCVRHTNTQLLSVLPSSNLCRISDKYKRVVNRYKRYFPMNFRILSYLKIHVSEYIPNIPKMDNQIISEMETFSESSK